MARKYPLALYSIFLVCQLTAQEGPRLFDLEEILELAATNALELKESNSYLKESQLQISWLQQKLRPQVFVNATLPNLSRSIESRPLPDGRDSFVNRSTMYNRLGIELNYQLASTGGTIYARSNLDRLDNLKTSQMLYTRNYFYTPIAFGINQPLFQFNEVKWQKERNQLLYKELTAQQFYVREEVIQKALQKYAEAFSAQLELTLTQQKMVETDSLYRIKQRLFDIGKATKVEILRLELEAATNNQQLEQAQLEWERSKMELCDYISLDENLLDGLNPPVTIQNVIIDQEDALTKVLNNAYLSARNMRRLREAETEIEIAVKDRGILFDLSLSLGLNRSTDQLDEIFQNMEGRQMISLGILVPVTGGKSRAIQREIAQEQLFRERISIQQERIELIRTVKIDVRSYALLNKNIELNEKAMAVAQEIYQLTNRQYLLGSQSLTELNIARTARDQALIQYYRSILDASRKYYEIRKNCLYDFKTKKNLVTDK